MALEWIEPNFANPTPYLPPPEVRVYDLQKEGRLDTPVHPDTGLVDRRALMFLIKSTVTPDYDWKTPVINRTTSDHHLQWPRSWYEYEKFRNHRSRRTNIRPVPHNWIHEVTRPAAPASRDVEYEYVEGREIGGMMRTVANHPQYLGRETLRIHREVYPTMDDLQLAVLRGEVKEDIRIDLETQLEDFSVLFEKAKAGAPEFQLIDYSSFELRNVADMMKIARKIGHQILEEATLDQRILDGEVEAFVA